jgi:hypothetical protein
VAADVIRTELKAIGGRRVRAGLRGAIEHLAGRHGMSAAEQREFASEVDAECCKFTAEGEPAASCEVVIEEQEDQIEVKVRPVSGSITAPQASSREAAPAGGSDGHIADGKCTHRDSSSSHAADNGHFTATLVRHFHKNPAHS